MSNVFKLHNERLHWVDINEICSQYEIMNSAKHSLIEKTAATTTTTTTTNQNNSNQKQQQPQNNTSKTQLFWRETPALPQTLSAALKVAKSASP